MSWSSRGLPASFWQRRRRPARKVDCVVVGGGIVGLSTAWWRQREGGGRVVLLEAGALAGRASGRNAGFLITGTPEPLARLAAERGREAALALWHRSRENRELLRAELLDSARIECDFLPEGSWIVALPGTGQEEELAASHELLREEGFDVEWRDAAAVREASGGEGDRETPLAGGLFQPRDGGLDPVLLCRIAVDRGIRGLGGLPRIGPRRQGSCGGRASGTAPSSGRCRRANPRPPSVRCAILVNNLHPWTRTRPSLRRPPPCLATRAGTRSWRAGRGFGQARYPRHLP